MNNVDKLIVIDLDDTIYSEFDYLKSAYAYIANKLTDDNESLFKEMILNYKKGVNVFDKLTEVYPVKIEELLQWYRFHKPNITSYSYFNDFANFFSMHQCLSLVTDGRSVTQRNKISALNLERFFKNIIISEEIGSEKPCKKNYLAACKDVNANHIYYIGDNLNKDFITPNALGWNTICLKDNGFNIHKQNFQTTQDYLPQYVFDNWLHILKFFQSE